MTKVKLTTSFPEWPLLRQTSGERGIWGDCQFFVNEDIEECDWWVVYENLLKPEKTLCSPENTIFITGDPPNVRKYDQRFLRQFAKVITCDRDINHPGVIQTQQALPWHIGKHYKNKKIVFFSRNYDELKKVRNFEKDRLISVISSNKNFTKGHKERVAFFNRLKEYWGPKIDMFGKGIRDIEDKWDGIARYKYHVVLENSTLRDYWTEKLSDAFLCGAYPFYYGCPNIYDYFPKDSLTLIDINDFEKSISIIEKTIENQQYERSIAEISHARDLVLDKYNLFPMICELCNKKEFYGSRTLVTLKPELDFSAGVAKKVLTKIGKYILKPDHVTR